MLTEGSIAIVVVTGGILVIATVVVAGGCGIGFAFVLRICTLGVVAGGCGLASLSDGGVPWFGNAAAFWSAIRTVR